MGVKLGRSHWGRNLGWGFPRIGCWGGYLGLRGTRLTGEWRRLHNEKLYALYSLPNNIQVIKSRRLRLAGYVARMGERRGANRFLGGENLREGDNLEDQGVGKRIIFKRIFEKWVGGHELDGSSPGKGQMTSSCECGNEALGSIKWGEFLE